MGTFGNRKSLYKLISQDVSFSLLHYLMHVVLPADCSLRSGQWHSNKTRLIFLFYLLQSIFISLYRQDWSQSWTRIEVKEQFRQTARMERLPKMTHTSEGPSLALEAGPAGRRSDKKFAFVYLAIYFQGHRLQTLLVSL